MAEPGAVPAAYLLLLPPPPPRVSYTTLRAAYQQPIAAALKQLTGELERSTIGCKLDVALLLPYSSESPSPDPRSSRYGTVQHLVAGLYKLVCIIAAKDRCNVEDAEGIDVRILLVNHTSGASQPPGAAEGITAVGSAIPSLQILARSQRPWRYVFSVESAEGEDVLRAFLGCQDSHVKIQRLPKGESEISADERDLFSVDKSVQYDHHHSVAVGGTFDHIHIGHKLLLTMTAFLLTEPSQADEEQHVLTVGITGEELLKGKKYGDLLESWDRRYVSVTEFIRGIIDFRPPAEAEITKSTQLEPGPNGHAVSVRLSPTFVIRCVEISDPFGPTITDPNITALVVSAETRAGGQAVNEKRLGKDWAALEVFEVDVLDSQEAESDNTKSKDSNLDGQFASKLSSTRIRQSLREKAEARNQHSSATRL